ncbi:MAG: hypothetical protein JNK18_13910 [Cyclobacteriaceae bacterium]|nr:hypothetical protein [Cyclobacteriaceae bacterium]
MAQRGKQELFDVLLQVEACFDVLSWQVRGIMLWPFIRHKISYEYLNIKQISIPASRRILRKFVLVWKGFYELFRLIMCALFARENEYLFLSKATYRTYLEGKSMDRFCDSLLELTGGDVRKKSIILESGSDLQYRKPRFNPQTVMGIQGALYLLGIFAGLKTRIYKPAYSLQGYADFQRTLSEKLDVQLGFNETSIQKQFNRILVLADFWTWYLRRTKIRKVFLVCFHEEYGYAMCLAGARLGIDSIDIQHGVEGKFHPVYSPYAKIPANGFELLPKNFWVWDHISFENIEAWKHPFHKPFLGKNVWLKYCQFTDIKTSVVIGKPMVLFSMQPLDDPLPDMLLRTIQKTCDRYEWFLRLHPRQFSEHGQLLERLDKFGLRNDVEITKGSQEPLPVLLRLAAVHATLWSSVVFEAYDMGVPSIVMHPTGRLMYSTAEYEEDFVHYVASTEQAIEMIDSLSSKKKTQNEGDQEYLGDIRKFVLS